MNDLDIDLDRNTPWVDMSACVKFGLDRPSSLAGHMEHRYRQTNRHNAFYYMYIDNKKLMTNAHYDNVTMQDMYKHTQYAVNEAKK